MTKPITCKAGHPYRPGSYRMRKNQIKTQAPFRSCLQCERNRRVGTPLSCSQVEQIKERLQNGANFSALYKANTPLYVANRERIHAHRARDPQLDKLLGDFIATRYDRTSATLKARFAIPSIIKFNNVSYFERFNIEDVYKFLPRFLPSDQRDDVAQDVIEALLKGVISPDQIRSHMRRFIASHNTANIRWIDTPLHEIEHRL